MPDVTRKRMDVPCDRKEQVPDRHLIIKKSVLLAGHRTSVSLEKAFWDLLLQIAREKGVSINKLVSSVDAQRKGNLSSALRLYVLDFVSLLPPDERAATF